MTVRHGFNCCFKSVAWSKRSVIMLESKFFNPWRNLVQIQPILLIMPCTYTYIYICDWTCKRGLIHAVDFVTLKRHKFNCKWATYVSDQNFQSYKSNDRRVMLPNFKAVGQTQAELHSLKVEKLDECAPYSGTFILANDSFR